MSDEHGSSRAAFALVRTPIEAKRRRIVVASIQDMTPSYRRIVFASPDLADFTSLGADDHLRIFFVPADFDLADAERLREHPSREYTPAAFGDGTLALDFVLHGTGPASEWAARAEVGDVAIIGGPRGSLVIEGAPDWWLLAGDLTALPAIRRHLAAVAPSTPVDVIIQADAADEQELETRGDATITWVRDFDALVGALEATPARGGDGFAFIAAEQGIVKPGRDLLIGRGIDIQRAVVKGYWRKGLTADAPKEH